MIKKYIKIYVWKFGLDSPGMLVSKGSPQAHRSPMGHMGSNRSQIRHVSLRGSQIRHVGLNGACQSPMKHAEVSDGSQIRLVGLPWVSDTSPMGL